MAVGGNTADHDSGHTQHRLQGAQLGPHLVLGTLLPQEVHLMCHVRAAVSHICCGVQVFSLPAGPGKLYFLLAILLFLVANMS